MEKQIDRFLEKAVQFEGKADKAENPTLKLTYKELARDYRTLAEHAERAQGLLQIEGAGKLRPPQMAASVTLSGKGWQLH